MGYRYVKGLQAGGVSAMVKHYVSPITAFIDLDN